jgi:flagellar biosynthetic protein FliP
MHSSVISPRLASRSTTLRNLIRYAVAGRRRPLVVATWIGLAIAGVLFCTATALAQESSNSPAKLAIPSEILGGPQQWTSPEGLTSALQVMFVLTVVSLAPALLMMTTCFIRVLVVLGLLRQALGTQQLPPNQVLTSLALFITLAVMTPVWKQTYEQAIVPYTNHQINMDQAFERGIGPIRRFMSMQIERCGNSDDVWLFLRYTDMKTEPTTYDEVPLAALLPAFMLSELKTAFLIGFQIYLPFLIIDMVVSSVLIAMGMMMLPPVLISLPFKLLLFVMIDGWHLIVGMLMDSFQAFT